MWHGFEERDDSTDPYRVFVSGSAFARQLDALIARNSHFLDLDSYLSGLSIGDWPPRSVMLTIDDGYVSTLSVAAPLLSARGVPAVMFGLAGRLGGVSDWMPRMPNERLLQASELRELEAHGVRVESHGWDHRSMPSLSPEELSNQVRDSRTALADVLGREPVAFAYPFGHHDAKSRQAVESGGYSCAFSVHDGNDGRFAIRRLDVNPTDTEFTFRLKLTRVWPLAYRSVGRLGPIRRGIHHLLGSSR
jgi:peptidoglycan/xylan/chitin deacetylase (PgdA/CDA1 family)